MTTTKTNTTAVTPMTRVQQAIAQDMATLRERAIVRLNKAVYAELLSETCLELWIVSNVEPHHSQPNMYVGKLTLARQYLGKKKGHTVRGTEKSIPFAFNADKVTVHPTKGETAERSKLIGEYAKPLMIQYLARIIAMHNADMQELAAIQPYNMLKLETFKKFIAAYTGKVAANETEYDTQIDNVVAKEMPKL